MPDVCSSIYLHCISAFHYTGTTLRKYKSISAISVLLLFLSPESRIIIHITYLALQYLYQI
jgi:hypothetical protein